MKLKSVMRSALFAIFRPISIFFLVLYCLSLIPVWGLGDAMDTWSVNF